MAHFAKIEDNIVTNVIVADMDFFDTFIDTTPGEWIQCSYNTRGGVHYNPNTKTPSSDQSKALRKNYPSIGFTYDLQRDAFISPQPFDSWTLNETTCEWEPPTPRPTTEGRWAWNEDSTSWVTLTT